MARLKDKVAIITGAAQGMGVAHARLFAAEGAKVVLTDINDINGAKLVAELGQDKALFVKQDVTQEVDWKKVIEATMTKFGKIDVLVNNAGVTSAQSIFDLSVADYEKIFRINQLSVFLGMKNVAAQMREHGGSIINVSSINGLVGGAIGYTDTKFAVRGMTKAAAIELSQYHIRVNSVHPGVIDTPMIHQSDTEAQVAQFLQMVPLKRAAKPAEVSELIVYLAADESSYTTGAEFTVDGGVTAM
ncbi:glucose 1-dehydrogenase [Agrilactobacillus fermenti]|uniref:glucose 1-dehydrogenase n=1 Tax=Agrilactobacillus fermenti TaxID=2586909 RepID=UPI001E5F2B3B|nr:glucose 1-dehydrogenase [Agrilactobacillus fermenti]MCD2257329.1 glucose 1-dehydrogenase [Agrilactobacillus fermenti]